MNKEEMQNYHIEMLIQDLEKHSLEYWEITQDRMVEALRNLQQKVNQLEEENQRLKDIYTNTIRHLRKIGRDELASWMECQLHPCLGWTPMVSTTNEQKEYGSRDIRTGKLSRINTKE